NALQSEKKSEDIEETSISDEMEPDKEITPTNNIFSGKIDDTAIKLNKSYDSNGLDYENIDTIQIEDKDFSFLNEDYFDSIIFDMTNVDEVELVFFQKAIKSITNKIDDWKNPRNIILISSIGTWGRTENQDPETENNQTLSDFDFRRRKPLQNFTMLYECEKTLLKFNRKYEKLNGIIICPGLIYGHEEDTFHEFFKTAWHSDGPCKIYGSGTNCLPTIHVDDLAQYF
ncbi:MAG: Adenylate kinase 7, partial [Paramarteilia canceri]